MFLQQQNQMQQAKLITVVQLSTEAEKTICIQIVSQGTMKTRLLCSWADPEGGGSGGPDPPPSPGKSHNYRGS